MKKYFILIFVGLLFGSITVVNAASIEFNVPSKIEYNTEGYGNVTFTPGSEEHIKQIEFDLDSNNKSAVDLSTSPSTSAIVKMTGTKVIITAVGDEGYFVGGNVAALVIKNKLQSSSDIKFTLSNIKFTTTDNTTLEHSSISSNIIILNYVTVKLNNEAKLSNIKYSVGKMTPEFKSTTKEYKIYNIKDTIKTLTLMPDGDVSYSITCSNSCTVDSFNQNKISLAIGKNIIKINTTSRDSNNTYEYVLTVYRGETTDGSNYLKSLTIDNVILNEEFDKNNLDYTAEVLYAVESLNIKAITEDENAKIDIKGNEDLIVGENVITLTVTSAESGDKKIYNIVVDRAAFEDRITTKQAIVIEEEKDNSTLLLILIIGGGVLIIGLAGYFIFKKNKPKKDNIIKDETISETSQTIETESLLMENENDEVFIKPSVDDALEDLMITKEIELNDNTIDNNDIK